MKRKIVIAFIILIILSATLIVVISISPIKKLDEISIQSTKKPVILIIVDSLMSEPLQTTVKEGKAPAFAFLINNGQLNQEMISSYPTMSLTIDSTLLTGTYPNQHKVPGLIWFKEDENRMISYGSGIREIWNNGVGNVAMDSIVHLNKDHLSKEVQTIHEELANRDLVSASINGLLYRGSFEQQLNVPKLISMTNLLPKKNEIKGPTIFSLGALSQYNPSNNRHKFVWNRMGVNNKFTANELKYLIEQKKLPSFTLAYLPDADASIHKHGPDNLKGIEKADQALQDIFNSFSSWEEAIQEVTWIVLGDSGQSFVNEDKETSLINLNDSLGDFTFWKGEKRSAQLAIAITYVDDYEESWRIAGNASILDLKVTKEVRIQYQDYPDALARLYGALHSQEGRVIIVDAKPSYEFIEEHSHDHAGGGAHGSLHKVDSVVPIIVTGTREFPKSNRLVDMKKWILQLLDGS
ncbi:phosphodiesterase [Lysinibacillus sp. 2017]|uniref:alkaline phosphatase family protein n=1 Tax=unclassified Lysinibacillus TaxID=2636778 RepID=UPI000D529AB5|nr:MULTISPECIES: alkaline phosphatase family protein [unclassified Lysinibacillus]AWE07386.1 phosphodiesterase [Lysinibacillus sp. 2017]TGN36548.1 alkaline phosphatase family protein [Lysinibacillus sp. S2017]